MALMFAPAHALQIVFQTDNWRARFPLDWVGGLPQGGRFFTTNANGDEPDERIVSYPLGAMWPRYEVLVKGCRCWVPWRWI